MPKTLDSRHRDWRLPLLPAPRGYQVCRRLRNIRLFPQYKLSNGTVHHGNPLRLPGHLTWYSRHLTRPRETRSSTNGVYGSILSASKHIQQVSGIGGTEE